MTNGLWNLFKNLVIFTKILILCFRCGMMEHQVRECLEGKDILKFGAWMMATPGVNKQKMGGGKVLRILGIVGRWLSSTQPLQSVCRLARRII